MSNLKGMGELVCKCMALKSSAQLDILKAFGAWPLTILGEFSAVDSDAWWWQQFFSNLKKYIIACDPCISALRPCGLFFDDSQNGISLNTSSPLPYGTPLESVAPHRVARLVLALP